MTTQRVTPLQTVVSNRNHQAEARFDLALVLLAKKDFDTAQTAFQNALKYKTVNTADAHNNIGVILALKGDVRAAEKKFEIALHQSGGKSTEAENNLRFCKFYKQRFNQNQLVKLEFSQVK